MQELQTCENCRRQFPSFKIHSHFSYCVRNIKKCPQCEQMVDMNHLDEHIEEFHTKLPCPFCKKEVDQKSLDTHKKTCDNRTVICEFCEQSVPIKQFDEHQQACGARTSPCPVCERPIVLKNLYAHAATCEGKPPESVAVNTGSSYEDYISGQRMEPRVISTTVTIRSEEPSTVRVLPIQKITIKASEMKSNQPKIIRYQPTQLQTRTITYKTQTPSSSSATYIRKPSETKVTYISSQPVENRITYVTRQPVQHKITYVTKQPVITKKISEVRYQQGVKVYGGIQSIKTATTTYDGYGGVRSAGTTRIAGLEDEDEELQRALLESMMNQ